VLVYRASVKNIIRFDAMNSVEIYEHLGGTYSVHLGVEG